MENEIKKLIFNLEKLPFDSDFSHHDVYGTLAPITIPLVDFSTSILPPVILDQNNLDFCTGFAGSELNTVAKQTTQSLVDYLHQVMRPNSVQDRAALAVKYELVPDIQTYLNLALQGKNAAINLQLLSYIIRDNGDYFDPLYQFAKTKQVRGEYKGYGANLRDIAKALVNFGSIRKNTSPFTYQEGKPSDHDRDFLANWNNWPLALDAAAAKNKLGSFFVVDGPNDMFDNIRSVLWKNKQAGLPIGVLFGLNWRPEWSHVPHGIINEVYPTSAGEGHCVRFSGQKIIDGVPYLEMPNSWGDAFGEHGVYYLPRNVVNTEVGAGYGAYTFKELPKSTAAHYVENNLKADDNWLVQLIKSFLNFILNLKKT